MDYSYLDPNKQQCIFCIGRRGSGKSNFSEHCCYELYNVGWTVIDLWASDNLENAFWCVSKKCNKDEENNHCNCWRRIPITILAPESIQYDQEKVDAYNDRYFSTEPLIKIVKLPRPTKTTHTAQNKRIGELFRDTVLHARKHQRVVVFNPKMFPPEREEDCYRTLDILVRKLGDIAYYDFVELKPEDVGKKSRDEMSNREKCYDKMVVLIREFGEVAPSRSLKTDQSGQSVLSKKALLRFVRKARHYQVSLITDFQNMADCESSIRSQCDLWVLKSITERLAGDEWKWLFKHLADQRKYTVFDFGGGKVGWDKADKWFPEIQDLEPNKAYVVYPNDHIRLWDIPTPPFHHKRPNEHWEKITGITFSWNEETTIKGIEEGSGANKSDKMFFLLVNEKRFPTKGKAWSFDKIKDYVATEQEKGNLIWDTSFRTMKIDTFRANFRRVAKRFEKNEEEITQ